MRLPREHPRTRLANSSCDRHYQPRCAHTSGFRSPPRSWSPARKSLLRRSMGPPRLPWSPNALLRSGGEPEAGERGWFEVSKIEPSFAKHNIVWPHERGPAFPWASKAHIMPYVSPAAVPPGRAQQAIDEGTWSGFHDTPYPCPKSRHHPPSPAELLSMPTGLRQILHAR